MGRFLEQRMLYGLGALLGVIIIFVAFVYCDQRNPEERNQKTIENQTGIVEAAVSELNAKGFDIMYFGEELNAPSSLIARKVYDFEKNTVFGPYARLDNRGHMIIINDPSGSVALKNQQLHDLVERVKQDNVILVYLGNNLTSMLDKEGIGPGMASCNSFMVAKKYNAVYSGVADDTSYLPHQLSQTLTPEQIPVYTLIMNLIKSQTYSRILE